MLDPASSIGYLAILSFSRQTPQEFDQSFQWLQQLGMRGMILDLRRNYGGVLESAVAIARRFVPATDEGSRSVPASDLIVSTEGRGDPIYYRADSREALYAGFPLVVLVDGDSASASEVLAGALQDHRVAVVTGSPTYGKGMVQTIRRFQERGTMAKVTSAYYYSPTHRNFERTVDPDRVWIPPDSDPARRSSVRSCTAGSATPAADSIAAVEAWQAEQTSPSRAPRTRSSTRRWSLRGRPPGPHPLGSSNEPRSSWIETSCDGPRPPSSRAEGESSSVVESQVAEHARFGRVVPEIAGRSHLRRILPVVDQALTEAGVTLDDLRGIAVTTRPGLIGSLLVGLSAAKGLAFARGLPMVGVHHIEAHVYAATMEHEAIRWPALALVVYGGHTALYRVRSELDLDPLASTLDDAAGEAFDKVAWLLGLPYPGGPAISALAARGDPGAIEFPRFHSRDGGPGFSFSGLKTAVLYHLRGQDAAAPTPRPDAIPARADVAASFEAAAVDTLVENTLLAARREDLGTILVAGGVACNARLRAVMRARAEEAGILALFPTRLLHHNAA
jgi:N6-L-threonylcarbamoyladenine synthase